MNKAIAATLLLSLIHGSFALASDRPNLDLMICAEDIQTSNFGLDGNRIMIWPVPPVSGPTYPTSAISVISGQGGPYRVFTTITPTQVLVTNAPLQELNGDLVARVNLHPKNLFEVPDVRDPKWSYTLREMRGVPSFYSLWPFDAFVYGHYPHINISVADLATGQAMDDAIKDLRSALSHRLQETPARVRFLFNNKQSQSTNLDHSFVIEAQDRFFTRPFVEDITKGLCSCETRGFQDDVQKVRDAFTSPELPAMMWETNKGPRKFTPSDFSCEMI